ncbi:hypothetical protein Y032_0057g2819 [Ancylostoma ceylanicum]|uniref:Uncharacterized protein n=1 Tax=Ancylostoma ceylanicum TaxID=53326 RepID=A0A016U4I0_9BILA|nr:hypothetical protein Y032_0057g2819 [Ancylostoma ceylanicum]
MGTRLCNKYHIISSHYIGHIRIQRHYVAQMKWDAWLIPHVGISQRLYFTIIFHHNYVITVFTNGRHLTHM